MRLSQSFMQNGHTTSPTEDKREGWPALHRFVGELGFFIGVTASFILPLVVYFSVANGPGGWEKRLAFFVAFLLGLEAIIIGVAMFERRRNRDVIQLGSRLATIYLSALSKSALNPQTRLPTSDE